MMKMFIYNLHIPVREVSVAMVTRLKHNITEMQLVVLLEINGTGTKGPTPYTPETNIVPSTGHHPAC